MSETYLLICGGKRYDNITLDEMKQKILDTGHSYEYVKMLVDPVVRRNYSPVTIGWTPGRQKNWIVNGVRMNRKTALFALEYRGHTTEEAECLLRCGKILAEIEAELECL